jgi:UTP--glucose-1-phosphate uridylyltransferase
MLLARKSLVNQYSRHIKKAVFPVAGMGSRFLPVTKANPKEMLPIVDKPLIQYAVEEALKAGLTEMIFVTSSSKRAIEDHFDSYYELEKKLLEQGKQALYEVVRAISPPGIHFTYVRQQEALGLGHALLCARHIVGNEPFAVLLADDLIEDSQYSCLSDMVKKHEESGHSQVAVQAVPVAEVYKYGIVAVSDFEHNIAQIKGMIEKPDVDKAPSNYAAVGRYVFTPEIFTVLAETKADHRHEVQLTDAIQKLIKQQSVDAYRFDGKRYDCGSKLGYVKATVEYALNHPEIGEEFKQYCLSLMPK